MNCESTGLHPEWSYQAVLYEMNVRQLTPEGTLRAAAAKQKANDSLLRKIEDEEQMEWIRQYCNKKEGKK